MDRSHSTGRAEALTFLHRVFADTDLRKTLEQTPAGLADLVDLGRTMGLVFEPADLQAVYRHEFALRWAIAETAAAPSAKAD